MKTKSTLKDVSLSSLIEHSIFDVDKLKELKGNLSRFNLQESEIPQFIEVFLKYLEAIFNSLKDDLSFYVENYWKSQQLEEFANEDAKYIDNDLTENKLKKQIRERDELLIKLRERITQIHDKILSK
jgi:RNA processing factor Prp31